MTRLALLALTLAHFFFISSIRASENETDCPEKNLAAALKEIAKLKEELAVKNQMLAKVEADELLQLANIYNATDIGANQDYILNEILKEENYQQKFSALLLRHNLNYKGTFSALMPLDQLIQDHASDEERIIFLLDLNKKASQPGKSFISNGGFETFITERIEENNSTLDKIKTLFQYAPTGFKVTNFMMRRAEVNKGPVYEWLKTIQRYEF